MLPRFLKQTEEILGISENITNKMMKQQDNFYSCKNMII